MFAPVSAQDLTLPNQGLSTWGTFEAQQWMAAGLQLNTNNYAYATSTSRLGDSTGGGDYQWIGGTLAANGKIYCPGHLRNTYLTIDSNNKTWTTSGTAGGNWFSAAVTYDKITNSVYSGGEGKYKMLTSGTSPAVINWSGRTTVASPQGFNGNLIYSYQSEFATKGIYVNTISANTSALLAAASHYADTMTLGINGNIYASPSDQTTIYEYNPFTSTASTFGSFTANRYYGMQQYFDGWIYLLPAATSAAIWKINPITRQQIQVGTSTVAHGGGQLKIGGDGRIYSITGGSTILYYDPRTQTDGTLLTTTDSQFLSIAVGVDGTIYCIPRNSSYINYIPPTKGGQFYEGFVSGRSGGRFSIN
jgi:hypothetical protein